MLTSDAKEMIYVLYKEYLNRRRYNIPKSKAKAFRDAKSVQESFFSGWLLADVEETMRELGRNGYLKNFYADNTIYDCAITDFAIAKLESQPKEDLLTLLDFISKFKP